MSNVQRRPYDKKLSLRLDWIICRMEAARGLRRRWWRLAKWWTELGM